MINSKIFDLGVRGTVYTINFEIFVRVSPTLLKQVGIFVDDGRLHARRDCGGWYVADNRPPWLRQVHRRFPEATKTPIFFKILLDTPYDLKFRGYP